MLEKMKIRRKLRFGRWLVVLGFIVAASLQRPLFAENNPPDMNVLEELKLLLTLQGLLQL